MAESSLNGRTAVVTGANSGVGRSATGLLLAAGARVTLVCRDRSRGERALAEVQSDHPSATATLEIADLAAMDSVRALAARLAGRHESIDILVNNAGVWRKRLELTAGGFERTFATNHLGHFLLTNLLLPRLSGGGHIVNVSSEAHRSGDLRRADLDEIARGRAWRGTFPAYADSKLANVLFTVEAARRWREHDVTVNAVHPGVLATGLWNQNSGVLAGVLRLLKVFMRGPRVGGNAVLSVLELALRHESAGSLRDTEDDKNRRPSIAHQPALSDLATGRYFRVTHESTPQPQATDKALAHELWERSLRWTGSTAECIDSEC